MIRNVEKDGNNERAAALSILFNVMNIVNWGNLLLSNQDHCRNITWKQFRTFQSLHVRYDFTDRQIYALLAFYENHGNSL